MPKTRAELEAERRRKMGRIDTDQAPIAPGIRTRINGIEVSQPATMPAMPKGGKIVGPDGKVTYIDAKGNAPGTFEAADKARSGSRDAAAMRLLAAELAGGPITTPAQQMQAAQRRAAFEATPDDGTGSKRYLTGEEIKAMRAPGRPGTAGGTVSTPQGDLPVNYVLQENSIARAKRNAALTGRAQRYDAAPGSNGGAQGYSGHAFNFQIQPGVADREIRGTTNGKPNMVTADQYDLYLNDREPTQAEYSTLQRQRQQLELSKVNKTPEQIKAIDAQLAPIRQRMATLDAQRAESAETWAARSPVNNRPAVDEAEPAQEVAQQAPATGRDQLYTDLKANQDAMRRGQKSARQLVMAFRLDRYMDEQQMQTPEGRAFLRRIAGLKQSVLNNRTGAAAVEDIYEYMVNLARDIATDGPTAEVTQRQKAEKEASVMAERQRRQEITDAGALSKAQQKQIGTEIDGYRRRLGQLDEEVKPIQARLDEAEAAWKKQGGSRFGWRGRGTEENQRLLWTLEAARGEMQAVEEERRELRQKVNDAQDRLTALTSEDVRRLGGDAGPAQQLAMAQADMPTVTTDADFDALPAGATFRDPEGNIRRKP